MSKNKKQENQAIKEEKKIDITANDIEEKEPGKVKKFFSKVGTILKSRWLIKGSTTVALMLVVLAIYICITLVMQNNLTLPEFDFTADKIYSLSDESKDKVGKIDKDVTITLINYASSNSINTFSEKYKALNDKINVEKIDDLSSRADLMQTYSLGANDSLIIVSCGDAKKTLSESELSTYDYTTYKEIDLTEEAITNAIVNVTTDEKPKAYFMTNHIAYSSQYYQGIMTKMQNESNEIDTLDILVKGEIPSDCNCLIITTLKEDITEQERDKILEYINNGGKILLMCGPNLTGATLTNFQTVLDQYGLAIGNGVIFEGNNANMLSGYPDLILEQIQDTDVTKEIKNMKMNVCLVDATNITFNEEKLEELKVKYNQIATTTDSAFIRTNLQQTSTTRTSQDSEPSTYTVAAEATKTIDDNKTSKLVIFSNEMFAMDQQIQMGQYTIATMSLYNNTDMVLNSLAYLTERDDIITIRKNYDSVDTYTATEQQDNIIQTIIFATPVAIIIVGIVVWQVRRRK